ncbi:MAG TPA: aldo/keto reductase [Candidatus Binataceae bacterium]|jgi:aryl-alcohol dehydrogenase-like predicted oxidoreductase|nr:aldo/keto reductase [Candidatus Binataceae bacterium]
MPATTRTFREVIMEYRRLGNSGLQVSLAGLGCNNFGMRIDAEQSRAVVHCALDEGITLFDTADIYGNRGQSEEMLGKALGNRRHEIVLASKFGMAMGDGPYKTGGSRRYIMAACEGSLKRLGTDYLDLYQIHQPDPLTPEEETLAALDTLVRAGKVRYLGNSNYAGWQVANAAWIAKSHGWSPYISAQNQYNLLDRSIEKELIPACREFGVGILPFFPLASGFLTGKYRKGEEPAQGTRFAAMRRLADPMLTDANFATLQRLDEFAGKSGHSLLELAVGWLATQPEITSVISGATSPEQVKQNAAAIGWRLSAEEMSAVAKLTRK